MSEYIHPFKSIIALLLIFFLLIQQFGCVTSNEITKKDLQMYYPKYAYAVHCDKSVYIMEKIAVINDTLSGKIFNREMDILSTGNFIRIYPSADSLVKINSAKVLSLPLSGIIKVKSVEEAPGKTTALVFGAIGLALLILAGIALSSMSISADMGI